MPHQIICLMHLATASSNTLVLLCLEEEGNALHDQKNSSNRYNFNRMTVTVFDKSTINFLHYMIQQILAQNGKRLICMS